MNKAATILKTLKVRLKDKHATLIADLLTQFASLEVQKRTVFVDSTGLLPPTRYAFRAIVPHLPGADLASVVQTALEVKLCSVGEVV